MRTCEYTNNDGQKHDSAGEERKDRSVKTNENALSFAVLLLRNFVVLRDMNWIGIRIAVDRIK